MPYLFRFLESSFVVQYACGEVNFEEAEWLFTAQVEK